MKKTLKSGEWCSKLTISEQEIIDMLVVEKLTIKQIASRRKTSIQAVYQIVQNLKEKGAFTTGHKKVENFGGSIQLPLKNGIRLHAEQWLIKILWKPDSFQKFINTKIHKDNNEIRIHDDSIEVYSVHSFFGSDTWAATAKSIDYWNFFFAKLEQELRVIFLKSGSTNIKRVKAEYAHIRNGLAIQAEAEGAKIQIRAREDGKVWFVIDNSFNLHEAETKHPQTAHKDMRDVVEPFFNDLRDNESVPLSQISVFIAQSSKQLNEVTHALTALAHSEQALVTTMKAMLPKPQEKEIVPKERPDYFG